MTDSEDTTPAVQPPRDYGHDDGWTEDPKDEFYVPPELRSPWYVNAEPSPDEIRGYVQYGVSIQKDVTFEQPRLAHPGRGDSQDIIVTEKRVVPTLVDLIGASGYKLWLHLKRLEVASHNKRRADFAALMNSRHGTCEVCGVRNGAVRSFRAIDPTRATQGIRVVGCTAHLPLLTAAAERAVAQVAADQVLPDG